MIRRIYYVLSVASLFFLASPATHIGWLRAFVYPPSDHLPPSRDPFYAFPPNLSAYRVGEVIRTRPARRRGLILHTHTASVQQVLYRTNNTQHEPSATVTTIFTPKDPVSTVISLQVWEDAPSLNCAPSYTLQRGLRAPNLFTGLLDTPIVVNMALSRGWYVLVPDHQGPRSAFMAGYEEGYATLDGIRAGLRHLHFPVDLPVGVIGYSGGGHATAWASHLVESYAPDLNIVGAAYGGTPFDLGAMVHHLNKQPFSGFIAAGIAGALAAYPDIEADMRRKFHPELLNAIDLVRSEDFCVLQVVTQHSSFDWSPLLHFGPDNQSFFEYEPVRRLIQKESLLYTQNVDLNVPKFPRYIWHAGADEMVGDAPALLYSEEQCSAGGDIVEVTVFPQLEHLGAMLLGAPRAVGFLEKALNGTLHSPRRPGPAPAQVGQHGAWTPCGQRVNYFLHKSTIAALPEFLDEKGV